MMMKATLTLTLSAAIAAGCASSGLSMRERPGHNQATYLTALYADGAGAGVNQRLRPFAAPARVAVAQVGEISPPQVMLDRLRADTSLFSRIEAMPAVPDNGLFRDTRQAPRDDRVAFAR